MSRSLITVLLLLQFGCNNTPPPAAFAAPPAALAPGARDIAMSDGAKLHVKIAGRGPACMFIHGGPGQDTLSFEQMGGSALEAFLTMVYVDQRGSGKSPDAGDYHLDRVVADFDEVRRALGVERTCVIAHSFGGVLAVHYAKRYPAHVSELIMANATLYFDGPPQHRMQAEFINQLLDRKVPPLPADADDAALATAAREAFRALMKSTVGYRVLSESWPTVKRMNEIESSYPRSRGYGAAVWDRRAEFPEYYEDYAPLSAEVRQPVLVITSRKDYAVGPDEYKRFRFPDTRLAVLDTGHISYYDANAAFVAAIRDFMAGRRD
jgi:proline iminopeptidase